MDATNSGVPRVEVKIEGDTERMFRMSREAYEAEHPDRAVRFGRAPEFGKAISSVPKHKMHGYKPVRVEELNLPDDDAEIFGAPKDFVRVGDTIMLGTSKENKERREKEINARALGDATIHQQVYLESLKKAGASTLGLGKVGGEIKQAVSYEEIKMPEPEGGGE